ncbi:2OG-Fe(II) oxygenase [Sphingobacterium suaedae]|uniref:2OG-Fe(II) oxygenase n=1 Tax=Sphingobacterium suaedae TaxID=1686402 RepID=A0ABW5KD69_9SPHI
MSTIQINPVYEQIIDGLLTQNFSVVDNFFTPEEAKVLREQVQKKHEEHTFKSAAIGQQQEEQVVKKIRSDSILWIDQALQDDVERVFFDKINDFIAYLNRTCYLGIEDSEFHYAVYKPGTFYKRHLDVFRNDQRRTLSVVFYLNDEVWSSTYGGQLTLYLPREGGQETEVEIPPILGRLAIFDSRLIEHEVKEVNRTRYSITGWLKNRGESILF